MEIPAGKFKAHCLRLIKDVQQRRQEIIVTRRGKPVAKLVPIDEESPGQLFGCMEGSVTILGDITAPIEESWDANADG